MVHYVIQALKSKERKIVLVHAIKTCGESSGVAPLIFSLGVRWRYYY
jgi:hypothetical protein